MTTLKWDANPRYELGVEKAVLYPDGGIGTNWNGVISVVESNVGSERTERFVDGVKISEDINSRIYQANLKAYGSPDAFEQCLGIVNVVPGFKLTNQPKVGFSLCYRTKIADIGYKLHIIYNATATETSKPNNTLTGKTADASIFEWKIDAVPPPSTTFKPTAHFVVDSTKAKVSQLALLEAMLYGTDKANPYLPTLADLVTLFNT